jgi:hypothetical protein
MTAREDVFADGMVSRTQLIGSIELIPIDGSAGMLRGSTRTADEQPRFQTVEELVWLLTFRDGLIWRQRVPALASVRRDASEEGLLSDNRDELPALLAELVPTGGISRSLAASLLDPNFVPGTIGLNRFRILRADHLDADASALAPCLRKRRVERRPLGNVGHRYSIGLHGSRPTSDRWPLILPH